MNKENAETAAFDPLVFATAEPDTAEMEVRHPVTGAPTGWIITFAGPAHPKQIALQDDLIKRSQREQKAIKQARVNGKTWKAEERTPDDLRRENAEIIAKQIVGWRGAVAPFSEAAAVAMLMDPRYFKLVAQITDFLAEEKDFTEASATT